MLERGLLTRILYPAPEATYTVDSFKGELIWIPKKSSLDGDAPLLGVDCVPCLLLKYPYSRFLLLFFHSNAEDLGRSYSFCCQLRDRFQVHVLAVEYPGYGVCPGVATGPSVMENAFSALHFATQSLCWPVDSILICGRSIGTGPAIKLTSLFRFAGVILVTPFMSIGELFKDRVGPFSKLVEEWYPNSELIRKVRCPVLLIHGKADDMISYRHAEQLFELIATRKLLVSPPSMMHNTNLMNDMNYLVMPATHFFSLPDYIFQDLRVPAWAFTLRPRTAGAATPTPPAPWPGQPGQRPREAGRAETLDTCCGSGVPRWDGCCSRGGLVDLHEAMDTTSAEIGADLEGQLNSGDPWDPAQPIAVALPALMAPEVNKDFREEVVPHRAIIIQKEEPLSVSM